MDRVDDLREQMLRAYDRDLRRDAELVGAVRVTPMGPVLLGEFDDGGGGFVSYRDLGGLQGEALDDLIRGVIAFFRDESDMPRFEWKTRAHDAPGDLVDHLVAAGLEAEEEETVMVGEAASLVVDLDLPAGIVVRRLERGQVTLGVQPVLPLLGQQHLEALPHRERRRRRPRVTAQRLGRLVEPRVREVREERIRTVPTPSTGEALRAAVLEAIAAVAADAGDRLIGIGVASMAETGALVGPDGQYHPLLGLGDPDFGVRQSLVFERCAVEPDFGTDRGAHLANGTGETACAAIGHRVK